VKGRGGDDVFDVDECLLDRQIGHLI